MADDHRNRLISVEFRDASNTLTKKLSYGYDAFNRMVLKQVDDDGNGTINRVEHYVWHDGQIQLITDGAGNILHRFLNGPAIDQVFADESSVNGVLWTLGDNQGSIRDVVNLSGAIVNHRTYSAFGEITSETNPSALNTAAMILTPIDHTGVYHDPDADLDDHRARGDRGRV